MNRNFDREPWYKKYQVDVPAGETENFLIRKFSVSEHAANSFNLKLIMWQEGWRRIYPGDYTGLYRKGQHDPVMSDTPAEIQDHWGLFQQARGRILMNGLGLGVALQACLNTPGVEFITVIEISQEVIDLVCPHYMEKFPGRFEVICADALTWKAPTGTRYNVVWHDIWDEITPDNAKTMGTLHRKYGRISDWQWSWCRGAVKRRQREERESRYGG